jgi:hypothetical protein
MQQVDSLPSDSQRLKEASCWRGTYRIDLDSQRNPPEYVGL